MKQLITQQQGGTRLTSRTTPSLLNETHSRLRQNALAFLTCSKFDNLKAIHHWMISLGGRLNQMADALQDEGAKKKPGFSEAVGDLLAIDSSTSPRALLLASFNPHKLLLNCYEELSLRLDMDADLYELLNEQHIALRDALQDMEELLREYDTYHPN